MKIKNLLLPLFILSLINITLYQTNAQTVKNITLEEKIKKSQLIITGEMGLTTVTGFANCHPIIEEILYGELPQDKELLVSFVETKDFSESHDSDQKYIFFLEKPRIDKKFKTVSFSVVGEFDYIGLEALTEERLNQVKKLIEKLK